MISILYNYIARTYAPDICRFWQPDPKAHDYHWLSPYAYCGGDPINFIDPTGEVLTTVCNGITYTWSFNAGYGWGFYDQDGLLYDGDDLFLLNLQNDLMKLINTPVGYKIVNSLMERSSVTTISNGKGMENNSTGYVYENNTGTVNMDYDDPVITDFSTNSSNNTFVALGHELVHALMGKNQREKWTFNVNGEKVEVNASEKYVTHYENMIRAEHGLELRTYYYYNKTGGKGGQLINPETRTSLFFNYPVFPGGTTIPYHYFRHIK